MKLRTEIEPRKSLFTLRPELPIVLLGSCFADNMGRMLRNCMWDAQNPLGVLFNPLSIAAAINACLSERDSHDLFGESVFKSGGVFRSWLSDSSTASITEAEILDKLAERREQLISRLDRGRTLCVTFGTSFGYFLSGNQSYIVANCHKQPASEFTRRLIEPTEIIGTWSKLIDMLTERFNGLRIIFTVSPVRHVRDGMHENTISKSILHLSVDSLCRKFDNCEYFPAYELLVDDLRDYRFYADDMVHPSQVAIEYIRDKFISTYLDDAGKEMLRKGEEISRRLAHRPIIADSPEALQFKEKTETMLRTFQTRYPHSLKIHQ